jgi:hypothetical protein
MRKSTLVTLMAAGLALLPISSAFSAPPNPTPTRESKLLVGFESDTKLTSDPLDSGENRASINTDPQFVAEGSQSIKVDLTDVADWAESFLTINFEPPVDIQGHLVLAADFYVPVESLNKGDTSGTWFQLYPHITTTDPNDATKTNEVWLGMRNLNLEAGWNHFTWDLKTGSDTKVTQLAIATSNNGDKPYSGPIYVDNIRVYKGSFVGVQPDEKLIAGFEDAADKDRFTGDEGVKVEVNTDKQFVQTGTGSLKIDLTGQAGGTSSNVVRSEDLGTAIDVSTASAIHLDFFIPSASLPTGDWKELGIAVLGDGGEVRGATNGIGDVTDQWVTLELLLTPEQAKTLSTVKGLYLTRNDDPNSEWKGPIYIDNLRAVVPPPPTAGG